MFRGNGSLPSFTIKPVQLAPFEAIAKVIGKSVMVFAKNTIEVSGFNKNFFVQWTLDNFDFELEDDQTITVGIEPAIIKQAVGKTSNSENVKISVILDEKTMAIRKDVGEVISGHEERIYTIEVDNNISKKICSPIKSVRPKLNAVLDTEHAVFCCNNFKKIIDSFNSMKQTRLNIMSTENGNLVFSLVSSTYGIQKTECVCENIRSDKEEITYPIFSASYSYVQLMCLVKILGDRTTSRFLVKWNENMMIQIQYESNATKPNREFIHKSSFIILLAPISNNSIKQTNYPAPKRSLREIQENLDASNTTQKIQPPQQKKQKREKKTKKIIDQVEEKKDYEELENENENWSDHDEFFDNEIEDEGYDSF